MKVALYARVSTRDKQNPEVQMRELREYVSKRGWEVAGEYIDKMGGTKDSRPQLDAMMKLAKSRKLDAIVFGSWTGSGGHCGISLTPSLNCRLWNVPLSASQTTSI